MKKIQQIFEDWYKCRNDNYEGMFSIYDDQSNTTYKNAKIEAVFYNFKSGYEASQNPPLIISDDKLSWVKRRFIEAVADSLEHPFLNPSMSLFIVGVYRSELSKYLSGDKIDEIANDCKQRYLDRP